MLLFNGIGGGGGILDQEGPLKWKESNGINNGREMLPAVHIENSQAEAFISLKLFSIETITGKKV